MLLRISKATYDCATRTLELSGWCLSPAKDYQLFTESNSIEACLEITPNTIERSDVTDKHPSYKNSKCGWRTTIKDIEVTEDTELKVVYKDRRQTIEASAKIDLKVALRVSKATYDCTTRSLELSGWCLSTAKDYQLFAHSAAFGLSQEITPKTLKRLDVIAQHPDFQDSTCGWSTTIKDIDITKDAELKVVYKDSTQTFETLTNVNLTTILKVSKAHLNRDNGVLSISGWCLNPDTTFDMFAEIFDTNVTEKITSTNQKRADVSEKFQLYGADHCSWSIDIQNIPVLANNKVAITYVAGDRNIVAQKDVEIIDNLHGESIRFLSCRYSPLRSVGLVRGTIYSEREHVNLELNLASGAKVRDVRCSYSMPDADGVRTWAIEFSMPGVSDEETAIVSELINPKLKTSKKFSTAADSPQRDIATKASKKEILKKLPTQLELSSLTELASQLKSKIPCQSKSEDICFYPEFSNADEFTNHYHRASWYLSGQDVDAGKVFFATDFTERDVGPLPSYFGSQGFDSQNFEIIRPGAAYLDALVSSKTIVVWRPLSPGLKSYLSGLLGGANVALVATDDNSSAEYGSYCRTVWQALPKNKKLRLLEESQNTFRRIISEMRSANKTCSAVFGTGPSIDRAYEFDFGNCLSIVCNTIISNQKLLDHIDPKFVCAGDAVSHFGVSMYAEKFRNDLITALSSRDIYLLTSAAFGYLLLRKYPELRNKVILCEQKFNGLNCDLDANWALPRFDSTLNIHMLPIATTFSDTTYLLGFDGKNPNQSLNEDFWAHSKTAQYHDLVETGHLAHPTFATNREHSTEARFLASVQESFMAGERLGKRFYTLANSFTEAMHARPIPEYCFEAQLSNERKTLKNVTKTPSESTQQLRALVVMRTNRSHFSGGRYHGTILAQALAEFCREVVIWTNNMPPWSSDMSYCPNDPKVQYYLDPFSNAPEGSFDYVVVLPDGSRDPSMFYSAFEKAKSCNAKTVFLNFESPNWFNALSPSPKDLYEQDNWFAASCFSDIILSSAETALPFAKDFYKTTYNSPKFAAVSPAINSPVADLVLSDPPRREKQIILISRFDKNSSHKNLEAVFDVISTNMQGYTLALVAGTSSSPDEATLDRFRRRLEGKGLRLELLHMISDRRKFEEIAKSELMIFPSLFEGFGYPPVEAGYMGTPCVAYDLSVLKEFNSDHVHFVPWGDADALKAKVSELLSLPFKNRVRTQSPTVLETAQLKRFSNELQKLLQSNSPALSAQNFSPAQFQNAVTSYTDGLLAISSNTASLTRSQLE